MKKKYLLIVFAIIITSILIGISILILLQKQYDDSLLTKDLYTKVSDSFVTDGGIYLLDEDVLLEISDTSLEYLIDYTVVRANNAKNINEIGIFRVETATQNKMKNVLERYVQNKQASYRSMNYFPEETEKIDFATVKIIGNYVVFSFLNEADTNTFYKAIENQLTK